MTGAKRLRIGLELLVEFLLQPTPPGITQDGLPPDAKIVSGKVDANNGFIELVVVSAEFEPSPYGVDPPLFTPLYHHGGVS